MPNVYSPSTKIPDLDCIECIVEVTEKQSNSRPLSPNDYKTISPAPRQYNSFKTITTPTIKNLTLPVTPSSPGFPQSSTFAVSPNLMRGSSPNSYRTSSPNIVRASSPKNSTF